MLRVAATAIRPTQGGGLVYGLDLVREASRVREVVALLSTDPGLYGDLTALENLRFAARMLGITPDALALQRVLDRVGLGREGHERARNMSSGMQRRLSISRLLLREPRVLLLDEPYNSLDPEGAQLVNALMRETRDRGGSVLLVAHDMSRADGLPDRTLVLQDGLLDESTATLLADGRVPVTGGRAASGGATSEADLYDPTSGTFAPTGNMVTPREGHTATLLESGKVLIVGGAAVIGGLATAAAELYDPSTGTFTATGSMTQARALHTATSFANGRVLVAGGDPAFYVFGNAPQSVASAEVYDESTGLFSAAPDLSVPRESHAAVGLRVGVVLVVGGGTGTIGYTPTTVLSSTDLYTWH